jgi:hypothetical protein
MTRQPAMIDLRLARLYVDDIVDALRDEEPEEAMSALGDLEAVIHRLRRVLGSES